MKKQSLSAPGQLALDLAPRPPADITARFVEYLRSEPSPDEVAQELVLGYLSFLHARASVISIVQPDATLRLAGGFGHSTQVLQGFGTCSLWDDQPVARAIREQRSLVVRLSEEARVPLGLEYREHPMVAVPLSTTTSMVGALCVCFAQGSQDVSLAATTLEALADVYVLYLLAHLTSSSNSFGLASHDDDEARSTVPVSKTPPSGLSARQLAILQLLSEGLTYDQIGARIGYSHSTVRMELMHIYRFFGVSARRDAVSVAMQRGLLPPTLVDARASFLERTE